MRASSFSALSLVLLLLSNFANAITLDCQKIVADGQKFNLQSLDDPYTLYKIEKHPPTISNTTFTLNICRPLKKDKDAAKDEDCPNGSRVCAIRRETNISHNTTIIDAVGPIAGEFIHGEGGSLDPKVTRLKSSSSTSDTQKEGLRLEMHGGKFEGQTQKAIIEFLCPGHSSEKSVRRDMILVADDDNGNKDEEEDRSGLAIDDGQGGTLKYISWAPEGGSTVLRLEWETTHACENSSAPTNSSSSGHWGFFTWFIIIVFLGVAAYLIFGSWLNYNRLGTTGFDSVPHADTIRDLPYLFRDWMRRVVDTVQGGHSRAGYSAV